VTEMLIEEKINDYLINCIKYHQEILKWVSLNIPSGYSSFLY
jgi:hypothetical protein